MASQVVPGTAAGEMEAALKEALAHVRPTRAFAAFVRIVLDTNILVRANPMALRGRLARDIRIMSLRAIAGILSPRL